MYCPRLKHFVRLNQDGSIGKCGHMINAMGFKTFDKLDNSKWLKDIKDTMAKDEWPNECKRCQQTEELNGESIRTKSIERHKILHPRKDDYLVVGGVLDNVCNSACQTCNAGLSTKIGSLKSKNYPKVNNYETFWKLPLNRILEVDVNGGEPTASKNYKKILANLPPNTKIVRMNTNGSRMIRELETILRNRTMVIVTLSFDGTGDVHDYVRWPIKWRNYIKTVQAYKDLQKQYPLLKLNCWTTVSSLNVENLPSILDFAAEQGLDHDWAFLNTPDPLNVKYKNKFTIRAKQKLSKSSYAICRDISKKIAVAQDNNKLIELFIKKQDKLRNIDIKDYFNFLPK
jgi:sulfatase maturation enzyme AslB (radical SAM superfamily)